MVVVVVRWYIKDGMEDTFKDLWKNKMEPENKEGLHREFFSKPVDKQNDKFHTLDLESKHYTTFINIGIWRDLKDFDNAIGKFIPDRKKHSNESNKEIIEVFDFEFKLRERIVMNVEMDRSGDYNLPLPSVQNLL